MVALIVAGLIVTFLVARDYHTDLLPFVVTELLFRAAGYRSRRTAVAGLAATAVFLAASASTRTADLGLAALAQTTAVFAAAWLLGRLVRARRTTLLARCSPCYGTTPLRNRRTVSATSPHMAWTRSSR